jgi:hypothetical protein
VAIRLKDEECEDDSRPDCRAAPGEEIEDRASDPPDALTGPHDGRDDTAMPPRYFTPEQAKEALMELGPVAEQMVRHRRRLVEAQASRADLAGRTASNGGDLTPSDFADADEQLEQAATALAGCIARIQDAGALVKDLDRGLLDFPARRGSEDIFLCWHVGEDDVRYWHGVHEGFSGRKPL